MYYTELINILQFQGCLFSNLEKTISTTFANVDMEGPLLSKPSFPCKKHAGRNSEVKQNYYVLYL